jgi:type IV pilus assembly protein PilA
MKLNNKGFSLVELMVVVAIIGILASVAIPSVNKYMAKARQSEAKTNLGSLYTSEKAFYVEYNTYDSRFQAVGFAPEGRLRYNIGFSGAGKQAGATDGYTATITNTAVAAGGATGYCGAAGTMQNGCTMLNGASGAAPPGIPATAGTLGATLTTANSFVAGSAARISSAAAAVDDVWAINQLKQLDNSQNGID